MTNRGEIHRTLREAEVFLRSGNPMGAIRRARDAVVKAAGDEELFDEAQITLERCEAEARRWRMLIDERRSQHRVFELRGQGLPAPSLEAVQEAPPRPWAWIQRVIRPRPRVATAS